MERISDVVFIFQEDRISLLCSYGNLAPICVVVYVEWDSICTLRILHDVLPIIFNCPFCFFFSFL